MINPKISICCLCYNHSQYISQTFESFLVQKGNFEIEIVVFDDCSTDNSREIIMMYKKKYPEKFNLIFPEKNTYKQGKTAFFDIIKNAKGEYVAFCEGDDYWISETKLNKQLEFIKKNPDINLVFHPALTLYDNGKIENNGYGEYRKKENHSFECILNESGAYMPMASIFARRSLYIKWFERFPKFFSENTWHSTIQILGAYKNGAGYLPETLSVYRSMHEGSWSYNICRSSIAAIKDFESFCIRNRKLNEITNYEYNNIFNQVLLDRTFKLAKRKNIKMSEKMIQFRGIPYKFSIFNTVKFTLLCMLRKIENYVSK